MNKQIITTTGSLNETEPFFIVNNFTASYIAAPFFICYKFNALSQNIPLALIPLSEPDSAAGFLYVIYLIYLLS